VKYIATIDNKEIPIETIEENGNNFLLFPDGKFKNECYSSKEGSLSILLDDRFYKVDLQSKNGLYTANVKGRTFNIVIEEDWKKRFSKATGSDRSVVACEIKSPMPGKIVRLNVAKGDFVIKGQGIIIIEAMKMENELISPVSGVIQKINVSVGDIAGGQDILVIINPQ
jgi:biotin carboxyl carrier protein